MTRATSPPELTVSENIENTTEELEQPTPQRLEQKFNLDDAFSVLEDEDSTSFDFNPDSFMRDLQSRDTIGINDDSDGEWENAGEGAVDMQSKQDTTDSTDASISTLDIDAEPHHSPATPPRASSSSQSMDSEAPPSTPPDDPTTGIHSQFTNISLSPHSDSSPHSQIHNVEPAYPNVIIDAKAHTTDLTIRVPEFPPSVSQQASIAYSAPIESTTGSVVLSSENGDSGHMRPSVNPTSAGPSSTPTHRPTPSTSSGKARSSGPSAFQKVVSQTRPPYLPPKQKIEDEKHRREWEEMMQRSRLAGK